MAFGDPLDPNNPLKPSRALPPSAAGAFTPPAAPTDMDSFNRGNPDDPTKASDPDGLILPGGMSAKTPPMDAVPGMDLPGPVPPPTPPETAPTPKIPTPVGPLSMPTPQATQATGGLGGYISGLVNRLPKALAIAQAGYGNEGPLRAIEGEEARKQQFDQQQFENTVTKQREDRATQLYSAQLANFQSELAYRQFQQQDTQRKAVQASQDRNLNELAAGMGPYINGDGTLKPGVQVPPEIASAYARIAKTGTNNKFSAVPAGASFTLNQDTNEVTPIPGAAGKPMTQEQNKLGFQNVVGKLDAAGLNTGDPAKLNEALDTGLRAGTITQEEHAAARGYLAANSTPATNLSVHIEGGQALQNSAQSLKDAHTYYRYQDPTTGKTQVSLGNETPQGVQAIPVGNAKDFSGYMNEANQSNIVQTSLNNLHKDIQTNPQIFDNPAARAILATTLEQMDRQHAGLLVAGTGGSIPLPSGLGSMINTALQNNALDKPTATALKQYIADYKSAKDKAIVMQMEMQGGKIGRGSQEAFNAIYQQIPNGATPDSHTALQQMGNLQQTQDQLASKYPESYSGFKRVPRYDSGSLVNPPAAFGNAGRPAPTASTSGGPPTAQPQVRSRQLSRAQFHTNYPGVPDSELEQFALKNKAQIVD